jgi:hypothetical protein
MLWADTDITVTVGNTTPIDQGGQGADFATLNDALEYMSKFMIIYKSDNQILKGQIKLLSGVKINKKLSFHNVDLSWVTIISEDSTVEIDTNSSECIYAENSKLPTFMTHFNVTSGSEDIIISNSDLEFNDGEAAIKNGIDNFYAMYIRRGSEFRAFSSDFNNATAVYLNNSRFISTNIKYKNCDFGIRVYYTSIADLEGADFTGTTNFSLNVRHMSQVNAQYCIFDSSISPNITVGYGSQVNITGSTGANPSQPLNTLTSDGIIFG